MGVQLVGPNTCTCNDNEFQHPQTPRAASFQSPSDLSTTGHERRASASARHASSAQDRLHQECLFWRTQVQEVPVLRVSPPRDVQDAFRFTVPVWPATHKVAGARAQWSYSESPVDDLAQWAWVIFNKEEDAGISRTALCTAEVLLFLFSWVRSGQ